MTVAKILPKLVRQIRQGKQVSRAIPAEEAAGLDKELLEQVGKYIRGETTAKPRPVALYRGVPKQATSSGSGHTFGEYTHATPWATIAARAGKGLFGSKTQNKVYMFPYKKDTKLYRGGALAGDPVEATGVGSMTGSTWDEVLEKAKQKFGQEYTRQRHSMIKDYGSDDPGLIKYLDNDLPKEVTKDTIKDIVHATFETDLHGKPPIWAGHDIPDILRKARPGLRSTDDLADSIIDKIQGGSSIKEALNTPEGKILKTYEYFNFPGFVRMLKKNYSQ